MPTSANYIWSIEYCDSKIKAKAEGVSHADSMLQPNVPANGMNWNIGHILVCREWIMQTLDPTQPGYDADEFALYGWNSELLTDAEKAVPLETLLEKLEGVSAELITILKNMPESRFSETFDDSGRTIDDYLMLYIFHHEAYHVGQLELARELADATNR